MLKCLIWDQNQLLANSYSRITVVWFVYFCIRSEFSQIQGALKLRLFFWNFQGLAYCLIFDFQGSPLSAFSATARIVYHAVFCLSTTFFIFFEVFPIPGKIPPLCHKRRDL